uniref:Uncharacterized protein n=1 Tax=Encephalitozoon cuniculi TaxID=6035 RepID=M1K505_ENCCN|nr:hypothetical protein ECU01_0770 [Encephalitozoon cuniculi]
MPRSQTPIHLWGLLMPLRTTRMENRCKKDLCSHDDSPSKIPVQWRDAEMCALDTGILCFGTDWPAILKKYGKYLGPDKDEREIKRQYYENIQARCLEEANMKHAVVVNMYGMPIYRNGKIVYFFCTSPLVELQKMVERSGEGYQEGEDIFVGTYFGSVKKIHRYRVSRADGIVTVDPLSTAYIENSVLEHEWKHAVRSHLRRHPYDICMPGACFGEEELFHGATER